MGAGDNDLLDRAAGGDEDALAALLERHGPEVRRALAGSIPRRWRSVLSLDDVMQQAYADAFLNIRAFVQRGENAFFHWLRTFASCTLIDAIRMLDAEKRGGGRRRVELPGQAGGAPGMSATSLVQLCEALGAGTATPSRGAARAEASDALLRAIEQLPPSQRRVVEMYDLEGRAVEQLAAALDRSAGAVYMLRARAHRRLGELLGTESKYLSRRA